MTETISVPRRRVRDLPRLHLQLMLALTFSTGIIDAVGYLGLDRVFTANMTGNVVILGMGLAGADDLPVLGPVLALVAFMAGAVAGGRALRGRTGEWTRATTWLLAAVGAVVLALGLGLMVWHDPPEPALLSVTTLLGAVMGLQAAAARALGVKDVTTVVVTSTITGLSMDSRLAGGRGDLWGRRVLAVVLILAGAGVGAVLLNVHLGAGLVAAAAVCLVCAGIGHRHARA
nr:YoaK family protein [Zafaria cholistanensis]